MLFKSAMGNSQFCYHQGTKSLKALAQGNIKATNFIIWKEGCSLNSHYPNSLGVGVPSDLRRYGCSNNTNLKRIRRLDLRMDLDGVTFVATKFQM